jgi:thiol-disulfide isomerase/thioredoxin
MKARLYRVVPGLLVIGMLAWFVQDGGRSSAQTAPAVVLKPIKYGELAEAVRAQKGKVLVIDVWADFCVPCKREFPNLVRLHKKYAEQGLVCFSVTVDPPSDQAKERCEKFLEKQQATFTNFFMDEPSAVWQNRWDLPGPPCVFVFDRQGKRAGKFFQDPTAEKGFTYEDVEKLVRELLDRKP